jgi:hypothetical protein
VKRSGEATARPAAGAAAQKKPGADGRPGPKLTRDSEPAGGRSEKDKRSLEKLVEAGKNKGFLTYDEVNDALPADIAPDQLDDVVGALGDEDIEIVDGATQVKIAPKRIAEEEAGDKKLVVGPDREEEDVDYYSKSNDPVRMYLRKMGSVSLLTREGEVEIAKRIEQGELRVNGAILDSPIAVREIIDLGEKLKKHKIRVKDLIKDAETDDQEFDEEEADRRIIRLIEKVKRLDKKKADLLEERKAAKDVRRKQIDGEIHESNDDLVKTLDEMRLNKKTIDKIVQKLKSLILKVEKAEAGATELEKRTGVDKDELRRELTRVKGDRARGGPPRAEAPGRPRRSRGPRVDDQERAARRPQGRGGAQHRRRRDPSDVRVHPRRRADGRARQGRARGGQPPPRRVDREEVHEPRAAVPGPDPGGQHRPDEGRGQVRVQARLQVLDVRHVVDPAGDHARDRRPGAHDPHPRPHDRDDQQAHPDVALPRAGIRPRADARGDRGEDGAAARQGPQGPEDREGAHQPRDARSARRKTRISGTSSRTRA